MPNKQFYLDLPLGEEVSLCKVIIDYAASNHSCQDQLKYIKHLSNGDVEVSMKTLTDETFQGSGSDRCNAVADALSTKFPG